MGTIDTGSSPAPSFGSLPRSPPITPKSRANIGNISPKQAREMEPLQDGVSSVAHQVIGKSSFSTSFRKIVAEKINSPGKRSVAVGGQTFFVHSTKTGEALPKSPPITRPIIPKSPPIERP